MRLLIVGDCNSQYVVNFAKYLKLLDPAIHITSFSFNTSKKKFDYGTAHFDHIYSFDLFNKSRFFKIPKISTLIKVLWLRFFIYRNFRKDQFDISCIHFVEGLNAYLLNDYKLISKKVVAAIWGTDLYRADTRTSEIHLHKILQEVDSIVVGSPQAKDDIITKFSIDENKFSLCFFGVEPVEHLIKLEKVTSGESKVSLGISAETLVITCGHNASGAQQHLRIFKQIEDKKNYLPADYILLVPLTYGEPEVVKEIKEFLSKTNLKYRLFEDFMTDHEVAMLRKATDIFIQLQTSDSFSGAMREHLFSGNVVITGEWLPYQFLLDDSVYLERISQISELGDKLIEVIEHFDDRQSKAISANKMKMTKYSSWPICIIAWYQLFNTLLGKDPLQKTLATSR